jgi:drug/metabolite transporter (DMT)-like permease
VLFNPKVRIGIVGIEWIVERLIGYGLLKPTSLDEGKMFDHSEERGARWDHRAAKLLFGKTLTDVEECLAIVVEETGEDFLLVSGDRRSVASPHRAIVANRHSQIPYCACMLAATALALASAVLHTSWNLVVKKDADRLLAQWGVMSAGALLFWPWLVVYGLPEPAAWPYVVASALVHAGYSLALVQAYEHGDLSAAYPVARGVAPLLTALGAAIWLDDRLDPIGYAGLLLVTIGLVVVASRGSGRVAMSWALATGLTITFYTLVDTAGVRAGDESFRYVVALFVLHSLLMTGVVVARRSRRDITDRVRTSRLNYLAGGVASVGAYGLVLLAVRMAPVGYVAALREASVILAAVAGWWLLKEAFGMRRTVGAAVVAAGIALMLVP